MRRISSASVLLVLVLGWAGAGIPRCGGDTVQEAATPPPRPARPRPRDVMSSPSQSAPSVPPAASQSQAEVFPRSSLPLAGGGRGAAVPATRRAAPLPGRGGRSQHRASARAARAPAPRGAARDRSAAAAAAGRAQPRHRGHRRPRHRRQQVCRVQRPGWAASASAPPHTKPGKSGCCSVVPGQRWPAPAAIFSTRRRQAAGTAAVCRDKPSLVCETFYEKVKLGQWSSECWL